MFLFSRYSWDIVSVLMLFGVVAQDSGLNTGPTSSMTRNGLQNIAVYQLTDSADGSHTD
jgi:hypothetical protein